MGISKEDLKSLVSILRKNDHQKLDEFLTANHIDPAPISVASDSLLCLCAKANQTECIKVLFKHGVTTQGNNAGVINIAAKSGNSDAVELLVENGADVNFMDWEGNTPLISALMGAHGQPIEIKLKIIKFLLDQGADLTIAHTFGNHTTVLNMAINGGDHEVVALIIAHQENTTLKKHLDIKFDDDQSFIF